MLSLLASAGFWSNTDHAKVCFVISWLVLWFIGFGIMVFVKPPSLLLRLGAVGVIALGFVPLGLLFGTP